MSKATQGKATQDLVGSTVYGAPMLSTFAGRPDLAAVARQPVKVRLVWREDGQTWLAVETPTGAFLDSVKLAWFTASVAP